MAERPSKQLHEKMISATVDYIKGLGYTEIKADHLPNLTQPDLITWESTRKGHIPDITAKNGNQWITIEAETGDSITIDHTKDQLKLFGAHAQQYNRQLIVVVPSAYKATAEALLKDLNITGNVWTYTA